MYFMSCSSLFQMTKMTDEVQSAFDEMIEEAGWMVPATQQFAKEKVW